MACSQGMMSCCIHLWCCEVVESNCALESTGGKNDGA